MPTTTTTSYKNAYTFKYVMIHFHLFAVACLLATIQQQQQQQETQKKKKHVV